MAAQEKATAAAKGDGMSDNNSASCVTDNVANDDSAASSSSQLRLSRSDQESEMRFDSDDDDVEEQQGDHIIWLKAKPHVAFLDPLVAGLNGRIEG